MILSKGLILAYIICIIDDENIERLNNATDGSFTMAVRYAHDILHTNKLEVF